MGRPIMCPRAAALLFVAGCGFQVSGQSASDATDSPGGEKPIDAPFDAPIDVAVDVMIDAAIDAPMIDAAMYSTTNHAVVADTFLASDMPNSNYSTQDSALADGDIARTALFRFDLTTIPVGASIQAAELHIFTEFDAGGACTFYPVLESWTEGSTTWTKRNAISNWVGAGATPPSRGTVAAGTVVPSMTFTEYIVVIDPALVTSWVAVPASNYGLAIVTTGADGTRFATKENGNAGLRPFMRISHTP
ncbi:MAG: hypothetical protein JWP01_2169 [Myxococcales bacterium]|nr:hypothetical protein [Myxococcales bacterium]